MKRLIILLLSIIFFKCSTYAQNRHLQIDCSDFIIPEGYYLMCHSYLLRFDTTLNVYVTFNDIPLNAASNQGFYLTSYESGTLKMFNINSNGDTVLLKEQYLKFKSPNYRITLLSKPSGSRIRKEDLRSAKITVNVPDNDMSEQVHLTNVWLKYYKNGILQSHQIYELGVTNINEENWKFIPTSIFEEISELDDGILIFNVSVKQGQGVVALTPAIYYFE